MKYPVYCAICHKDCELNLGVDLGQYRNDLLRCPCKEELICVKYNKQTNRNELWYICDLEIPNKEEEA